MSNDSPAKGEPPLKQDEDLALWLSRAPNDPENAAYWSFVPAVKEAVQDAVHVAVRQAIHEVAVPPGAKRGQASRAYRRLVADSLNEAAKSANEYLRQASVFNELPSSDKASETTVIKKQWQENVISPSRPSLPDKMETVSLNAVGEILPTNNNEGWKLSSPFKKGDYAAIPDRQSSKKNALSPKLWGTNSPRLISPRTTELKDKTMCKWSYEQLRSRESVGLRSVSSAGSLRGAADKLWPSEKEVKQPDDQKRISEIPPKENLGRNNTIRWLLDLLSSNGPYDPRLTALPPRTRKGQNASTGRIRSRTAPAMPVSELYLGATPKPTNWTLLSRSHRL
jgi:serine/arginine repetitive matrix protein 2